MTIEKQRTQTYYVNTCTICGKEFEVMYNASTRDICRQCQDKKDEEEAIKALKYLVGAEITVVTPSSDLSRYIGEIVIKTRDGDELVLRGSGWDGDRYIEVEPVEEQEA